MSTPATSPTTTTVLALPVFRRQWLSLPFGCASGTEVRLIAPLPARPSSWAAALPILALPSPVSPDAQGLVVFDLNSNVVRFVCGDVSKPLAKLEPIDRPKSMMHFYGKIHSESFEIQINRNWFTTTLIARHRPSNQTVTIKLGGDVAFDFWPGLRVQRRPSGPYAFYRSIDDPRNDDFSLKDAVILSYDQEYEALGQILGALLLWHFYSRSSTS